MDIEITVKEAHDLWKQGTIKLLDVRGEDERGLAKIEGVPMIDQALAQEIVEKWPKDTPIVLVKSLSGGIDAWSQEVDKSVPRY